MPEPLTVDRLEVLVLVDNVTDSLSTTPKHVIPEWSGLLAAGRLPAMAGRNICCAHHGLSLLLTAHLGNWELGGPLLAHHGYKLSPGTLYPILHGMEVSGYLRSSVQRTGRQSRRVYRATSKGRKALAVAKERVRELFGELVNE